MKIGAFSSEELSEPLFNLSCRMLSWLLDESLSPNSFFLVSWRLLRDDGGVDDLLNGRT